MATAPLLNQSDTAKLQYELIGEDGDYIPARTLRQWRSVFRIESEKLWIIAIPIAMTTLCQFGLNSVTNIFVGHIGDLELSSFSIAMGVINMFSFGFMLGMGSATETLCGQAFGAGQLHMLGIYMQRSWIVLGTTCIFIMPIYIFATPILKLTGQQDDIAELAGEVAILTIPQLFSLAINFPTQKFLQAQSKVNVLAFIGFGNLILHCGLLWLFVFVFKWGTTGAAIAFDITSWTAALAQVIYIIIWCKDSWTGLSAAAFRDIWPFVRLSFSSAVMLCLEVWYMMSINLLTGNLDNAVIAVGSLTICSNINGWEGMVFFAISAAISVRVSNELGLGRPRATKYSVKEMQEAVSKLAYLLGVTMVLNSVQPVISGVAIGGGWQALVAYINLGSYYAFGLPLGYVLGYIANLGVQGLWGGMIIGLVLQTVLLLFVLYKTNWTKEVEETSSRMEHWGGHKIESKTSPNHV
ncbi:Protein DETOXIFICATION [Heracleum sosnowskyi]|uniref:Protein DETOXIFICATION n=1 Tax=Heracleum sosnowskyi TaxID=360622 RepID=A0AAD8N1N0_9APIA|nr:Protein DETOXIFICATION [Heracleum sosnowskyi]